MRIKLFLEMLICFPLLAASVLSAEESQPSEYQLKAVFLYNFAKFVEWPPEAFASRTAPFTIGVVGQNPFGDELERTVRDKGLSGHPFAIKHLRSLSEVSKCQILFICASERKRLAEILKAASVRNVLTVAETDRFLQAGGMIRLVMEGNKVRFDINDEAAKSAGLRISSKLLSVARHVETAGANK